jgi:AbrB family looped-hinge helix DNA binding protein
MSHKLYTAHMGDRGRIVVPSEVRRRLGMKQGTLLTFEVDEDGSVAVMRTAAEVARSGRGLLRDLAGAADLTAELIRDRREEAVRESASSAHASER